MHEKVLKFISRFTGNGHREEVIDCFMNGCCYWFAKVLAERFKECAPLLMYAPVEGHFGALVGGRVYDITGDVTERYNWVGWDQYRRSEPSQYKIIRRDCVMF